MSSAAKSLKKVSGLSKKTLYGLPLTKKPRGDSGDYLQAFTAGAVAPEEQKLTPEITAPVTDDRLRKLAIEKEEARRRRNIGVKSTLLTGSSKLG